MAPDDDALHAPDTVGPELYEADVESVRTAAKWTMGASGAVATVLLAGFQFGDIGAAAEGSAWAVWVPTSLAIVALALLLDVFRAATLVMVPDRVTLDDLLKEERERLAHASGVRVGREASPNTEARGLVPRLVDDIRVARGWLLPENCASVSDLQELLRRSTPEDRLAAETAAGRVLAYVRMEVARRRYREMVNRLTGWRGVVMVGCLIGIVASSGFFGDTSPQISEPVPVRVTFDKSSHARQVLGDCAGTSVDGVAVAGNLIEPLVVFPNNRCGGRQTVNVGLGVAVPMTTLK